MPSLSRDELERSVIGSAFDAQSTHLNLKSEEVTRVGRRKKDRRRKAEDTAILIKKFLIKRGGWVTLLDICDDLDRAPGPHLRGILISMIEAGEIETIQDFGAGPVIPRFLYRAVK